MKTSNFPATMLGFLATLLALTVTSADVLAIGRERVRIPELALEVHNGAETLSAPVTEVEASYYFYGGLSRDERRADRSNKFTKEVSVPVTFNSATKQFVVSSFVAEAPKSEDGRSRPWSFSGLQLRVKVPMEIDSLHNNSVNLSIEQSDLKYLSQRFGVTKAGGQSRVTIPLYIPRGQFLEVVRNGGALKCNNGLSVTTFLDRNGQRWVVDPLAENKEEFLSRLAIHIENRRSPNSTVRLVREGLSLSTWDKSPLEPYLEDRSREESLRPSEADASFVCDTGSGALGGQLVLPVIRPYRIIEN